MQHFILIRGPLGVGKTTVSKKLADRLNAAYFSVDHVLEALHLDKSDGEGIPAKNFIAAQEHILPTINHELGSGRDIIIDGNFYHKEQIEYFEERFGSQLHIFTLHAPVGVCIERDRNRGKPYGEDAANAVHWLVSRFDAGLVVDTEKKSAEDVVGNILANLTPKDPNVQFPSQMRKNIKDEWGRKGEAWLKKLPALIKKCQHLWNLEIEESAFELSYNYVTSVRREDGSAAILKIGYPHEEIFNEMKTLILLNGHCTARLLHSDEALGAMLLEKISPGKVLKTVQKEDDEKATRIAAELIKGFPVPVPAGSSFPTVAAWAEAFERVKKKKDSPLPLKVLKKAQSLFAELERSKTSDALLHGDLHHDNILFDEKRGWLSIDPKGVIGDPLFNAARFLNNPNPDLINMDNPKKVIERRVEILSSVLEVDRKRLVGWAYVDCVLTACWWIESGGETCNFSLRCAEIFDSLL